MSARAVEASLVNSRRLESSCELGGEVVAGVVWATVMCSQQPAPKARSSSCCFQETQLSVPRMTVLGSADVPNDMVIGDEIDDIDDEWSDEGLEPEFPSPVVEVLDGDGNFGSFSTTMEELSVTSKEML